MQLKSMIAAAAVLVTSFGAQADGEKSLHDFTVTSIEFKDMPLAQYEGKAVLLVNTASYCGYTPQYKGLQALWEEYRDEGLVVVGVPANDFGDQEPGNEKNIKNFCKVNFQVDFPMTKKMVVKGGPDNAPVYEWLAHELGEDSRPKWNFHKYLIDKNGHPVAYFSSKVTPQSDELKTAVEKELSSSGR
ncbi:glutathione peroxidase [Kordiimonas aestuarii]|uniref:glutathione peroxidase n=1 Tax=Kordiimonas aestuarii TaxID=1005925 RepID=UPI0021D12B33|nr:glutathione peroxidase [Kordiimonas aestuarii]